MRKNITLIIVIIIILSLATFNWYNNHSDDDEDIQQRVRSIRIQVWANESVEIITPFPVFLSDLAVCSLSEDLSISEGNGEFTFNDTKYGPALRILCDNNITIFGVEKYQYEIKEPLEIDMNNSLKRPVVFSMSNVTNATSLGHSYPYPSWYFNSTLNGVNVYPWEDFLLPSDLTEGVCLLYTNTTEVHIDIELQYRNIGSRWPLSDTWWNIDTSTNKIGWNISPIESNGVNYM